MGKAQSPTVRGVASALFVVLLATGCVGNISDPAGDSSSSLDIVEAGVDFREVETRFWVEFAAAPAGSSVFSVWCFQVTDQPCGPNEDPSFSPRLVLSHPTLVYSTDFGRGGASCGGYGRYDGDRVLSVTLLTECFTDSNTLRFSSFVMVDGTLSDSTGVSPTVVISQ